MLLKKSILSKVLNYWNISYAYSLKKKSGNFKTLFQILNEKPTIIIFAYVFLALSTKYIMKQSWIQKQLQ